VDVPFAGTLVLAEPLRRMFEEEVAASEELRMLGFFLTEVRGCVRTKVEDS